MSPRPPPAAVAGPSLRRDVIPKLLTLAGKQVLSESKLQQLLVQIAQLASSRENVAEMHLNKLAEAMEQCGQMLAGTRGRRLLGTSATPAELAFLKTTSQLFEASEPPAQGPLAIAVTQQIAMLMAVFEKRLHSDDLALCARLRGQLVGALLFGYSSTPVVAFLYFECLITMVSTFEDEELPVVHQSAVRRLYLGRLRDPSFCERTKSLYSLTEHFKEEERFTTLNHDHLKRRLPDLLDCVDRDEYKKAQAGTSVDDPHGNLFVPAITMGFRNLARLITHTKRNGEILQLGQYLQTCLEASDAGIEDSAATVEDINPLTGASRWRVVPGDNGFAVAEVFPSAAAALREVEPKSLGANAVDVSYLLHRCKLDEARELAASSLRRKSRLNTDSQAVYFYHALSEAWSYDLGDIETGEQHVSVMYSGLRWAKRGIAANSSGFYRWNLLRHSVEALIVLIERQVSTSTAQSRYEAQAPGAEPWSIFPPLLCSLFADLHHLVLECPLDYYRLHQYIQLYVSIAPVVLGSTGVSPDLAELQPAFERLRHVYEVQMAVYGKKLGTPGISLACELQRGFVQAASEWDAPLGVQPRSLTRGIEVDTDGMQRVIADCFGIPGVDGKNYAEATGGPKVAEIERNLCSYCRTPDRALKACPCQRARYCDSLCQNTHWGAHKSKHELK